MTRQTLVTAAARVAAPGTDPELLAAVVAWLAQPRKGPAALRQRCDANTSEISAALRAAVGPPTVTQAAATQPLFAAWLARGVQVALVGDVAYPYRIAEGWPHAGAPVFLAWRGQPPGIEPAVAIVGARRASSYGEGVATWISAAVAAAGGHVVSGGALGVDAAAHRAALELPGGTTVVLGCGHDVDYPRAHAREGGLFTRVLEHGGTLVSELLPYEPPRPGAVRERNRIVAALADVVVVVEGGQRSGSLLTANAAAQWGRTVLAVPGDVRAPGSHAPHRLLADGAAPCTEPRDVLDLLDLNAPVSQSVEVPTDPLAARLVEAWPRALSIDELSATDDRTVSAILAWLTRAEMSGLVSQGPDGVRLARQPG